MKKGVSQSITGAKAKWYSRFWWNHRDDLNEIGVKVGESEDYTEYAVHYMIKKKKDPKSSISEDQLKEGDDLIRKRENDMKLL